MAEDDTEFQGLLEEKQPAPYPNISAKLPGVELESEETGFEVITEEPEPNFRELAAAALENAGINQDSRLWAAREFPAFNVSARLALVEANDDKIVCKITFDLLDAGLTGGMVPQDAAAHEAVAVNNMGNATGDVFTNDGTDTRCYPSRICRNVVGHQPYDTYAPRTTFLQLGEVHARRSVLDTKQFWGTKREDKVHATMCTRMDPGIDNTVHAMEPALVTESEDEMKVWGYIMTQYNLKPGLQKIGARGATTAIAKLTQLHIMDMWTTMDPSKLAREDRVKALSL